MNRTFVILLVATTLVALASRVTATKATTVDVSVYITPVHTGLFVSNGGTLVIVGGQPGGPGYSLGSYLPSAPVCALIGNDGNGWFYLGLNYQGPVSGSGELLLVLNYANGNVCVATNINLGYISPAVAANLGPTQGGQPSSGGTSPTPSPVAGVPAAPATTAPPAPDDFRIASNDAGFGLVWDPQPASITIFDANGCNCMLAVPAGASSFAVSGIAPGVFACFIAYASNSAGYSPWSDWACATAR